MDLAAVSTCLPDALQGLESKKCYGVAATATARGREGGRRAQGAMIGTAKSCSPRRAQGNGGVEPAYRSPMQHHF